MQFLLSMQFFLYLIKKTFSFLMNYHTLKNNYKDGKICQCKISLMCVNNIERNALSSIK